MNDEFIRHNRWQYTTADLLQARIETHLRYSERKDSWSGWLAAQIRGECAVGRWLDVGSGDGTVLTGLAAELEAEHIVAYDQSVGMLAANGEKAQGAGRTNVAFVNGDAQALPFADGSFDLVTAHHMLYHVPNIGAAVVEMCRVLKPNGAFLASTNTADSYAELHQLRDAGVQALGLNIPPTIKDPASRFALEDGEEYITPHLPNVQTRLREDALLFTDVEGLMRYLLSGPLYFGTQGPDDPSIAPAVWDKLADWVATRAGEEIAAHGVFRVSKAAGVFVATKMKF